MNFIHDCVSPRVVFGEGSAVQLVEEMKRMGVSRALVLTTPRRADLGRALARPVAKWVAAYYAGAAMHVPASIAQEACSLARDADADCVIAIGGGSTVGLGKILALRLGLPVIALPTTYAGSEMTPIFGITDDGAKKTGRDIRALPRTAIYDPVLTQDLPAGISVTSAINAIAHAAEGLYAPEINPILTLMARQGIAAMIRAIPRLRRSPRDLPARSDALYGAWLCGSVLGNVSMALHHKLCHTLGGTFGLPHAETHTVVLPHALAYNAKVVPQAMAVLCEATGQDDPLRALFELARDNGAPVSLEAIGMREEDIGRVCDLALENRYPNPRELDREALMALLENAYFGRVPQM